MLAASLTAIDTFVDALWLEDGLARNTLAAYRRDLSLYTAWLAGQGHAVGQLVFVISADNLAGGIASSAFIAYLSSLTNVNYSATQYALFSSMMLLAPKWLAGFSGVYVDAHGYEAFFTSTALLGAPVLLLVWLASRILPVGGSAP